MRRAHPLAWRDVLPPALAVLAALAGWRFRLRAAPTEPIWDGWRYQVAAETLAHGGILTWNHVGFSALAVPLLPVFGARATWALSMAAGVLGIVAAYALVRHVTTPWGGAAAAWLLALTPVHAYWSGTGHSGTLALLVALVATRVAYAGRGWTVLALTAFGVTVRPDFIVYAPLLLMLPRLDARVPAAATRPLLLALPVLVAASIVYLALHGGRPGRVAWTVPPQNVAADWYARAKMRPDGTLGLGPAAVPWSPAYALPNLAFYAGVLADWSLHDWSGWITYLPRNLVLTPLALVGAALWPRRWGVALALVAVPNLGAFAFYYGFSPEYVFPILLPALLAAGAASAWLADGAARGAFASRTITDLPGLTDGTARGPLMLDRIRNLIAKRDAAPAQETPRRWHRTLLLVALGVPREHGPLRDLVPGARAGPLEPAPDKGAALARALTGRNAGDGDATLLTALREHDVPFVGVNVPARHRPGSGRFAGPGPDADADAQVDALVASAEASGWHALVGVLDLASAPPERAWAHLEEALTRTRRAAGNDAVVMVLADDGARPEVLVAGPGTAGDETPLAHVSWVDACPTMLRALDLNVPEGLDGYPVEEAFESREWSEEDERKVQEHLEKLGYL